MSQRMYPLGLADGRHARTLRTLPPSPADPRPRKEQAECIFQNFFYCVILPSSSLSQTAGKEIDILFLGISFKRARTISKEQICDHFELSVPNACTAVPKALKLFTRNMTRIAGGRGTLRTPAQVVHCPILGVEGAARTDCSVYQLLDCRWVAFLQNMGTAKDIMRELGNAWLVLTGFF